MISRTAQILVLCSISIWSVSCGPAPGSGTTSSVAADQMMGGAASDGTAGRKQKQGPKDPLKMSAEGTRYFNAGVNAGANGNLQQAEQAFARAIELEPAAPQPLYNLGVVFERRGADLKALKYYKQSIQKKGDYYPALAAAAKLLLRYGKHNEAIQIVRTASNKFSSNIKIVVLHANVLTTARKYNDAIRVAKRALRLDERSAAAMLQIGKANLKMGRLELAESIFSQVLSINENLAEVYFLQGLLELKKGFRILAIKKFEKAIEKNPFYPEALNNLAIEYMLAGNYSSAITMLERAIQITPSWGVLYLNYGNALRGAGKWKRAYTSLKRAQKMLPRSAAVTFNLAVLYYTANELNGLNRVARLQKSRELFAKCKAQGGSSTAFNEDSIKYIKELDVLIEREQVRMQRQREAAAREKERKQHKSTAPATGSGSDAGKGAAGDDDGWETADDDGWD